MRRNTPRVSQSIILQGNDMKKLLSSFALSLVGVALIVGLWSYLSGMVAKDLPSPVKTWQDSKLYVMHPWEKRGEMDQGIARMAAYSLLRVAKGFSLAILMGAPLGFLLGGSPLLAPMFDPAIQVFRPVPPWAWRRPGMWLFPPSEPAAVYTVAQCSSVARTR